MADGYTEMMLTALKEVHPQLNDYDNNTRWDWNKFYEYVSYRGWKDTEAGGQYFNDPIIIFLCTWKIPKPILQKPQTAIRYETCNTIFIIIDFLVQFRSN